MTKTLRNSIRDKTLLVICVLFAAALTVGSFALGASITSLQHGFSHF